MHNAPTEEQLQEIGTVIVNEAYQLFVDLKIEGDFCVQSIGYNCVVFGGTNRIIWSVRYGFRLDAPYCSDHVVRRWGAMNGQPISA
jgi:hypothetical protein